MISPEELDAYSTGDIPTDNLLELTQTNITKDPELAFHIAQIAYGQASNDIQRGIAARQAAFRAAQAGESDEAVDGWFATAEEALKSLNHATRRERAALRLLQGRVLTSRQKCSDEATKDELSQQAMTAFEGCEAILQTQHHTWSPWDRYATMLARLYSAHETENKRPAHGAILASMGIWRAIRAERSGTPEGHLGFVAAQVAGNGLAFTAAVTQPAENIPGISRLHRKLMQKLIA